jgi:CRP-like cAMP-binding protein
MELSEQRLQEMAARSEYGNGRLAAAATTLESALFDGLTPAEVHAVLGAFDEQSFNAGHRVTLEGFRGREFYLITQGTAAVSIGDRRVAELGPGDFFGEVAVLGDGLRSATVTAATPLRCLVLSDDGLERLLVDHPRLGLNMLREVVTRFADGNPKPATHLDAVSS